MHTCKCRRTIFFQPFRRTSNEKRAAGIQATQGMFRWNSSILFSFIHANTLQCERNVAGLQLVPRESHWENANDKNNVGQQARSCMPFHATSCIYARCNGNTAKAAPAIVAKQWETNPRAHRLAGGWKNATEPAVNPPPSSAFAGVKLREQWRGETSVRRCRCWLLQQFLLRVKGDCSFKV